MTMDFMDYQGLAMRTASSVWPDDNELRVNLPLILSALGLAGEAGEVADEVKKWLNHGHPLNFDKLDKEIGDILWYCARYALWRGVPLGDLAMQNIEKLRARYPEGFDTERSLHRKEA